MINSNIDKSQKDSRAEGIRLLKNRRSSVQRLTKELTEDALWEAIIAYQHYPFFTASGLPYRYELHKGYKKVYTKELFIDRCKNSKSLVWSSVKNSFQRVLDAEAAKPFMNRPKALGDIRGVSYIYPLFSVLGLIEVPEHFQKKMCPKTSPKIKAASIRR